MLVFLNGQLLPEEQATVSVFDRGFLYGDGLFESVRIFNAKPFRWAQHMERLQRGADFLKISLPFSPDSLLAFAGELITRNQFPDSLLRIVLSRGSGPRGYSPKAAVSPTLVMSLHPAPVADPQNPPRWRLITSSVRLPANDSLSHFKNCNKLPQILARAEADAANADEALLLNTDGHVVEASGSNLFWIEKNAFHTPPVAEGILPGVTRAVVFELARGLDLPVYETNTTPEHLRRAGGVFLSVTSFGIVEALSIDGRPLSQSPLVARLSLAYASLLRLETL